MSNQNIITELFDRLKANPPESLKDLTVPLARDTLSRQEFGAAMSNKWLAFKDKRYFFTTELVNALNKAPSQSVPTNYAPKADKIDMPIVRERPIIPEIGELATTAQGPLQVKILEVVYRGKNKLGHPNLLLMGETGLKVITRIERGIPLNVANSMLENPNKFNGRVIIIDEKQNFVGIVLAQVKKEPIKEDTPEINENADEPEIT